MATSAGSQLRSRPSDFLLGGGILGILTVLVLPLPPMLLDFLITLNVTGSLMLLLVAMYIQRPPEFSVFPSLLLVTTLYRLSLNVAATRLILLHGSEGATAAGRVIQGFGQFVVGGNFVVGVVLFLILVVIQFVVITKGAGRIAEVAARFTLDAMPGKQMAIDADLNAGLIDDQEARRRREQISREGDFYGAMDGASKFVRGDAVAGIIITAVNILGGLAIGLLQDGLALDEALATYTILTVGDGLVAQIPALIISTAAGIVVSRAASESDLSEALLSQLTQRARPLGVASGVLGALGLMPGMPLLPFLVPAGLLGMLAYRLRAASAAAPADGGDRPAAAPGPEKVEELLALDPLQVELGYGLLPLVDDKGGDGGDLLARIRALRRQFATELGFVVPPVRVRDSAALGGNQYVFRLHGSEISRGEVFPDRLLAMNPGTSDGQVDGLEVREPTFGLPARWIPEGGQRPRAGRGLHGGEREHRDRHASERDGQAAGRGSPRPAGGAGAARQGQGDASRRSSKASFPPCSRWPSCTACCSGCSPRVSRSETFRPSSRCSATSERATRDAGLLAEHVRPALADTVCRPYLGADGGLRALLLSPDAERAAPRRARRDRR